MRVPRLLHVLSLTQWLLRPPRPQILSCGWKASPQLAGLFQPFTVGPDRISTWAPGEWENLFSRFQQTCSFLAHHLEATLTKNSMLWVVCRRQGSPALQKAAFFPPFCELFILQGSCCFQVGKIAPQIFPHERLRGHAKH